MLGSQGARCKAILGFIGPPPPARAIFSCVATMPLGSTETTKICSSLPEHKAAIIKRKVHTSSEAVTHQRGNPHMSWPCNRLGAGAHCYCRALAVVG